MAMPRLVMMVMVMAMPMFVVMMVMAMSVDVVVRMVTSVPMSKRQFPKQLSTTDSTDKQIQTNRNYH
jgi:hypothetical protein